MSKEQVTDELVRQNGNQAASVMADYVGKEIDRNTKLVKASLFINMYTGEGLLDIGEEVFTLIEEDVTINSTTEKHLTISQLDFNRVFDLIISNAIVYDEVTNTASTSQVKPVFVWIHQAKPQFGGTYIAVGSTLIYRSSKR